MALVIADRVRETTTTTGTGTITLAGAVTNFETFTANLSNSDTTYYAIIDNTNGAFEVGLGTFTSSGTTLARSTIIASSNSNSAVNFGSGTKDVFITIPASKMIVKDASGNVSGSLGLDGDVTIVDGSNDFDVASHDGTNGLKLGGDLVTSSATELNILDGKSFVDEDNMASNSATAIPSQQSVKAYVDTQITAEDLDFQADSGGALNIDLDSETLTFTGGTGIDTSGSGNAVTFAIDSTVATLTGSQTLTNKTLTTPTINGATIGSSNLATSSNGDINLAPNGTGKVVIKGNTNQGKIVLNCENNSHGQTIISAPHSESANNTLTLPSTGGDARLVSTASTATLTNKTLTAPVLSGSSSAAGSILFKEDTDNGTNAVTLIGPASTTDVTVTLPSSAGTVALTSDIPSGGISSGNVATFTSGAADDDFLRIDGTAIEGRSASEVLSDIGGQASLTFGISNTNAVKIDSASVADDEYARFTANGLESRSTSEVLSDIGGQASLTFGISNTNAVKIDSASVADDEFARFTANGLESRSASEVASDIGAATKGFATAMAIAL